MMSICQFAKSCGVPVVDESTDNKGRVTKATSECDHAIPHVADGTCRNQVCQRMAPVAVVCVEIKEPVVEPTPVEDEILIP